MKYTGIKAVEGKRVMTFMDKYGRQYISEITAKVSKVMKSDNRTLKEFYIKKYSAIAVAHDLLLSN